MSVFDALGSAAEVVAGVLGIAMTVVAIVVELAATRYNHRITTLFVKEPVNVIVLSFFVATAVMSFWVSATELPVLQFIVMIMVSVSLLALLPYFAFVLVFISPLNMIERIKTNAIETIHQNRAEAAPSDAARSAVMTSIDALEDLGRSAVEQNDRDIAIACVNALADLMLDYETVRDELNARWFDVSDAVIGDPDFVALETSTLHEISADELWLEVKLLRQYHSLVELSVPKMREVANLIGINARRFVTEASSGRPALLNLVIRFFNVFLRATIKSGDERTTFYLLNQYRIIAEHLVETRQTEAFRELVQHMCYYGEFAYSRGQPFLLELVAVDITQLIEASYGRDATLVDYLLERLLNLDREILFESQEESLIGIRRVQVQIAMFFLNKGDEARARQVADDLAPERRERLARLKESLTEEDREQYWEFTDRGSVNFRYLQPERARHLDRFFAWLL